MKTFTTFIILQLLFFAGFSQISEYSNFLSDSTCIGPIINSDKELEDEDEAFAFSNISSYYIPNYIDSFYNVPAYKLYLFWDTTDIHPYQSKMNLFNETYQIDFSKESFSFPLKKNEITSNFGWRRWRYHYGIDIKANIGDTIYNCFDGVVRIAQKSKSYGNTVVIRHNNGLETLYAHLSKIFVCPNQEIRSGDLIGLAGNSGRSTGPHLHFEVRFLGGAINPNDIINFENMKLISDTIVISKNTFSYLEDVFKARYYVVRKGDTLAKIAKKYGVSISKLCKLNGINHKKILKVGQKIRYR